MNKYLHDKYIHLKCSENESKTSFLLTLFQLSEVAQLALAKVVTVQIPALWVLLETMIMFLILMEMVQLTSLMVH